MIQILLVDDDARAINAIAANIDWQAAGIDKHYLAYNSSQAKQIMSEEKIDILLSDIEMPKGSGLELADWVKKNVGDVVCIFLTSYALFDYAREAIRLGSSDYILKPAPYETILQSINRAVEQVENNRLREIDTEQAELWNENHALVTERFWYDVATGAVSSDLRSIEELARSRHVDFRDQLIRPVLFELASVVNDEWEPGLLEKSLINILQELFLISDIVPVAFRLEPDNFLVLVGNELSEEELQTTCSNALTTCHSLFARRTVCFWSEPVSPDKLFHLTNNLLKARHADFSNNSITDREIIPLVRCMRSENRNETPDYVNRLIDNLQRGNFNQVLLSLKENLSMLRPDRQELARLYQSLMWSIYPLMEKVGIAANELFSRQQSAHLAGRALQTSNDLYLWFEYIIHMIEQKFTEQDQDVIARVQRYIRDHLADDLNRNDIANEVFLSPDHLSHVFRERTGSSLSEYIIEQRMEKAKTLISTTRTPIQKIATETGYNNIPYFTKLFKRYTGMTPKEYRKKEI